MTKIIQRHDTAANWTSINPVLAAGEMGVETDTNKFKFGDGVTVWNSLAYAAGEGGGGSGTTLTSADGTTTYSKLALGDNLVVIPPEIPWTNPKMSSNSQDGYVASASSTQTTNSPYRAFDKDTTGQDLCWFTGSISMPQWIMLECPEPVRLTSCMIMNEVKTPESFKSGYIQGSNDGSTFDTLYTITDRAATAGLQTTYQIDTNNYYKYLRVYCTATSGNGLSIQEIEFSGFTKDHAPGNILGVNLNQVTEQVSTLESTKQDKLTAEAPLKIYIDDEAAYRVTAINGEINTTDNTFTGTSTGYLIGKNQDFGFKLSDYNFWEFRTKIRFAKDTEAQQTIFTLGPYLINLDIYKDSQMRWSFSTSSTHFNVNVNSNTMTFTANTIYYIRLRFTGTQYIMERSTTGFGNMTTVKTYSSSTKIYSVPVQNLKLIAANPAYGSTVFLEDTCLIGNGEVIWKAYDKSKVDELKITNTTSNLIPGSAIKIEDSNIGVAVFDKSKFTIIGNPTITDDGIASEFSSSNYLTTQSNVLSQFNSFEIISKIKTPTYGLNTSPIISWKLIDNTIVFAYISINGFLNCKLGNFYVDNIGSLQLQEHANYFIKVKYDTNNIITLGCSIDGYIYNTVSKQYTSSLNCNTPLRIGCAYDDTLYMLDNGSIDLSQFSISVDGKQVFSGTKTLYQALDAKQENVKTLTGYSDTGTLVLKSINGVLQWVAEG